MPLQVSKFLMENSLIVFSLSRLEWLCLKQEYQKLQREAMKQTKMNLKHPYEIAREQSGNVATSPKQSGNVEKTTTKLPKNATTTANTEKQKSKIEMPAKLEMIPGVVLKYNTKESIEKQKLRVRIVHAFE